MYEMRVMSIHMYYHRIDLKGSDADECGLTGTLRRYSIRCLKIYSSKSI